MTTRHYCSLLRTPMETRPSCPTSPRVWTRLALLPQPGIPRVLEYDGQNRSGYSWHIKFFQIIGSISSKYGEVSDIIDERLRSEVCQLHTLWFWNCLYISNESISFNSQALHWSMMLCSTFSIFFVTLVIVFQLLEIPCVSV